MVSEIRSMFLIGWATLCLLSDCSSWGIDAASQWDRQEVELQQGDDLTVTCTVTDMGLLDVVRISKKDRSGTELTIADDENVKAKFLSVSRIKVFYAHHKNGSSTSVLNYQGIQGEDAGNISCYSLSDEKNPAALLHISVQVPVDSVRISALSEDGNERSVAYDEVTMIEDIKSGVACTASVNGSLTPPTVRILIDSEDRTLLFTAAEQSKDVATESGLGTFYSEMKLSYITQKPEPNWNGKKLTCVAKQNGFPEVTSSLSLIVRYKPLVSCLTREVYARLGERVTITCEVRANPSSTITWKRNAEEKIVEDDFFRFSEGVIRPDVSNVSLTLDVADHTYFAIYSVVAQNDRGTGEGNVELLQFSLPPIQDASRSREESRPKDVEQYVVQTDPTKNQGDHFHSQGSKFSTKVGRLQLLAAISCFYLRFYSFQDTVI